MFQGSIGERYWIYWSRHFSTAGRSSRCVSFVLRSCRKKPNMIVVFGLSRNLGHNSFPVFPSIGLENALHIKVHNNPNLREFPTPSSFPRVKTLALSYAYHCCPFQQSPTYALVDGEDNSIRDSIIFPSNFHGINLTAWASGETAWVDSSKSFLLIFFVSIYYLNGPTFPTTDPMWTNMSQQWAAAAAAGGLPSNDLSEADIEKLLSSSSRKSGVMFMTTRKNNEKKNPVACIPEPSIYNIYI